MATAPIKPSGASITEYITVTSPMLSAKQATLSGTPAVPTRVVVDIVGGISQGYTNDFVISGNIISWNSMGLQTLLDIGDILRVSYFIV